jgi:hypothetical protein
MKHLQSDLPSLYRPEFPLLPTTSSLPSGQPYIRPMKLDSIGQHRLMAYQIGPFYRKVLEAEVTLDQWLMIAEDNPLDGYGVYSSYDKALIHIELHLLRAENPNFTAEYVFCDTMYTGIEYDRERIHRLYPEYFI